jgi:hypothetical protein
MPRSLDCDTTPLAVEKLARLPTKKNPNFREKKKPIHPAKQMKTEPLVKKAQVTGL